MRKNCSVILAASVFCAAASWNGHAVDAAPYCPPGAKYCPAPGADNTVYLDTHFGVDAATGEMTAYKGTQHPDDVYNPVPAGEQILYTSPPISVENRFVPNPGAARPGMNAAARYPQPTPAPQARRAAPQQMAGAPRPAPQQMASAPRPAPQAVAAGREEGAEKPSIWSKLLPWSGRKGEPESEVANSQVNRLEGRGEPTQGDQIPWYKGGWWRNRDDGEPDNSRAADSARKAPSASPSAADDDMWEDEEYSGYNPDGSIGRPAPDAGPYARPVFGGGVQPAPQAQPYSDPYMAGQPAPAAGGFVGEAYTLPNSPPPTSPYQQGYVYPGTDISYDSTYQGGYPGQTYAADPYAAPTPIADASDPYTMTPSGGFYEAGVVGAVGSPTYQAPAVYQDPAVYQAAVPPPIAEATGSPQFENAVRMVKDNRFSEAKSILSSETSRNPQNAAAWRWLGDCHYNLLELDAAIDCYQRALTLDPNDYYALRGHGFSYLHRGHEHWRGMQDELKRGMKEQAAATFSQAHDNYKKSLEILGLCLRRAPNDGEAIYGEAMAAEGASRKLYSNAVSYMKLGPQEREKAELFAENCLTVINKGVERAKDRAHDQPGDSGPRALLGGLYLRKAILYHQLGKNDLALIELKNSHDVQKSILDEIDRNNVTAQNGVKECESYWEAWGGAANT